jgi:hypothetical protein
MGLNQVAVKQSYLFIVKTYQGHHALKNQNVANGQLQIISDL